jgi:hypothetical protein
LVPDVQLRLRGREAQEGCRSGIGAFSAVSKGRRGASPGRLLERAAPDAYRTRPPGKRPSGSCAPETEALKTTTWLRFHPDGFIPHPDMNPFPPRRLRRSRSRNAAVGAVLVRSNIASPLRGDSLAARIAWHRKQILRSAYLWRSRTR